MDKGTRQLIEIIVCMQPVVHAETKLYVTFMGCGVVLAGRILWDSECDRTGVHPQAGPRWLVYDSMA